jgi:hypothetical protein
MASSARAASVVLAIVGSAVILVGCGSSTPTPTASPVATAPAAPSPTAEAPTTAAPSTPADVGGPVGTTGRIVDESAGFAVTLPDGWRRLDLTAEDREAIIGAGAENLSPEARTLLEGQLESLVASGLTFFAIDEVNATDQFVPNINILASPTGGLTLDMLTQATVGQLQVAFPTMEGELVQEQVTLPSGEATHLSYSLPAGSAGAIDLTFEQYLVVADGTAFIMTVTGQDPGTTAAAGEAVAGSFELLD